MYEIGSIYRDINNPSDAESIKKFVPLLKTVLGFTDKEIERMIEKKFVIYGLAKNLTKEQVLLAFQPFCDIDAPMYIREYDDFSGKLINSSVNWASLGLVKQSPKDHYYDSPIIPRENLIDPDYIVPSNNVSHPAPQPTTPTITCPYCKSTDCKKISGLSKAGSVALWGIFALGKTTKQWHCNNCKSDF